MGYTLSHIQKVGYHAKHSNEYMINIFIYELGHDKTYKMACAPSEDSDQPGLCPENVIYLDFGVFNNSITSMARTRMAHLPWLIQTLFSVHTKVFHQLKKTNI